MKKLEKKIMKAIIDYGVKCSGENWDNNYLNDKNIKDVSLEGLENMKYERACTNWGYISDVIMDINKYYSDWRIVNIFHDNSGLCVAILEREVEE